MFSNNTIHIDVTLARSETKPTLCIDLCTTPSNDHAYFSRLTGTAHALMKEEDAKEREEEAAKPVKSYWTSRPVQSERCRGRELCDSNQVLGSYISCDKTVQLSTQLPRTCRQVNLDAALLPYSTNTFNFSGGLHDTLCAAFIQKFSVTQRRAIQTAIVDAAALWRPSGLECVQKIPDLLPGLKRLWLRSCNSWGWDIEEDFARVKLPSLVGVSVQLGERLGYSNPSWLDRHGEYLELALLDNTDHGDLALCKESLKAKWVSGERPTWGFGEMFF